MLFNCCAPDFNSTNYCTMTSIHEIGDWLMWCGSETMIIVMVDIHYCGLDELLVLDLTSEQVAAKDWAH